MLTYLLPFNKPDTCARVEVLLLTVDITPASECEKAVALIVVVNARSPSASLRYVVSVEYHVAQAPCGGGCDSGSGTCLGDCKWTCCDQTGRRSSWPGCQPASSASTQTHSGPHTGKMHCQCAHHLGPVSYPLDKTYYHLKDMCRCE
jgi:hypothetical protein